MLEQCWERQHSPFAGDGSRICMWVEPGVPSIHIQDLHIIHYLMVLSQMLEHMKRLSSQTRTRNENSCEVRKTDSH